MNHRNFPVRRIIQERDEGKWKLTLAEGIDGIWTLFAAIDDCTLVFGYTLSRRLDANHVFRTVTEQDLNDARKRPPLPPS